MCLLAKRRRTEILSRDGAGREGKNRSSLSNRPAINRQIVWSLVIEVLCSRFGFRMRDCTRTVQSLAGVWSANTVLDSRFGDEISFRLRFTAPTPIFIFRRAADRDPVFAAVSNPLGAQTKGIPLRVMRRIYRQPAPWRKDTAAFVETPIVGGERTRDTRKYAGVIH